jgi:hypothetical protein
MTNINTILKTENSSVMSIIRSRIKDTKVNNSLAALSTLNYQLKSVVDPLDMLRRRCKLENVTHSVRFLFY